MTSRPTNDENWTMSRPDMDSYDHEGNYFVQVYRPGSKTHQGLPDVVARLYGDDARENAQLLLGAKKLLRIAKEIANKCDLVDPDKRLRLYHAIKQCGGDDC